MKHRASPASQRCLLPAALALASLLAACQKPPVFIEYRTADQIAICRDTEQADFQEAEDLAASFCASKGLLPRLAGTERCARHSVRYNYICWARGH